jgi:hypothetical protein
MEEFNDDNKILRVGTQKGSSSGIICFISSNNLFEEAKNKQVLY